MDLIIYIIATDKLKAIPTESYSEHLPTAHDFGCYVVLQPNMTVEILKIEPADESNVFEFCDIVDVYQIGKNTPTKKGNFNIITAYVTDCVTMM